MSKILITGALGQIGSDLTDKLNKIYGIENVVISDMRQPAMTTKNAFEILNVTDYGSIKSVVTKHKITKIFHLAAILSATGERNPNLCWDVNMNGLYNIIEIAREMKLEQVITPSSIAVFGPSTPRDTTPQQTILLPETMYGLTKVSGELLCSYYVKKFGVDIRGLRYPGLISYKTEAGGGTTDYAVEIYYDAILRGKYKCFLREDTMLPMMYMEDALKAMVDLADAKFEDLHHNTCYNIAAMSFTPKEIANSIRKFIPNFEISYEPDYRQKIADSWPKSIDDSAARKDWGWKHEYDLDRMTEVMIRELRSKFNNQTLKNA